MTEIEQLSVLIVRVDSLATHVVMDNDGSRWKDEIDGILMDLFVVLKAKHYEQLFRTGVQHGILDGKVLERMLEDRQEVLYQLVSKVSTSCLVLCCPCDLL